MNAQSVIVKTIALVYSGKLDPAVAYEFIQHCYEYKGRWDSLYSIFETKDVEKNMVRFNDDLLTLKKL